MVSYLGIEFTKIGSDYIEATMPVDHRTKQPMGLLHGGANVVLAETLGSIAASLTIDLKKILLCGSGNQCQSPQISPRWESKRCGKSHSSRQNYTSLGNQNFQ